MTDREILELAAKAAGVLTTSWYGNHAYIDGMLSRWNPLTDDGDALRLAVKLRLAVEIRSGAVCAWSHDLILSTCCIRYEELDIDPEAATRRAIVRAAAEIGMEMQCSLSS